MRWAPALLAFTVLALGACGETGGLPQDLQVSGAVTAHVMRATPTGECQVLGGTYQGQLVSGDLSFHIEMRDWHGPDTYAALYRDQRGARFYALTMKAGGHTYYAKAGAVTVAADQHSGTLDVALAAPDGAEIKVLGTWRCA